MNYLGFPAELLMAECDRQAKPWAMAVCAT